MAEIKFRQAKPSDAGQIASCHWSVRDRYTLGIFLSLGESFLRTYYKIVLDDPWEIAVCAERDGQIIGFATATMDAHAQAENLKRHKIRLGLAALGAIMRKPALLKAVWQRYKSLNDDGNGCKFVHTEGVRGEYWCWRKSERQDATTSMKLNKAKYKILYDLGVREMFFEVDKFNTQVYKYHINFNHAEPIEEITLPDGRQRVLMKKILTF